MPTERMIYQPRGTVRDYWASSARECLVEGPVRTGKSAGICEKDQLVAMRNPGTRILWLRRHRASLTHTILPLFENDLAGWSAILNRNASRPVRDSYRFLNGSEIVVGGLDRAERIMGAEYDRISIFEATEVEFDAYAGSRGVLTRLSGKNTPYQQATLDCNPQGPTHWINERANAGHMRRFSVGFKCNPRWWNEDENDWTPAGREYVLGTLGRLEGVARARLVEGRWVQSEGTVYSGFSRAVHCEEPDATPARVVIGVDEGFTDPFAALRLEIDPDGRVFVTDERYGSQMSYAEKLDAVAELGGADALIVYDAAAAGLGNELRGRFPDVTASDKSTYSITDGIGIVSERIALAGDGRPRLFVSPACENLLREVDTYEWRTRSDGSGKDTPVDSNNHALDALRYAVVELDDERSGGFAVLDDAAVAVADADRFWT